MKSLPAPALLGLALLVPAAATHAQAPADAAPPASAWPITGNLAITTNYISRGFTQSWGKPAVQGGIDYAHPSGFYLGTWLSSISGTEFRGGDVEWDVYGGYGGSAGPLGYTVGLAYYAYPGTSSPAIGGRKYDYGELKLGATYGIGALTYYHVLTHDWFGTVDNGRGSGYLDLSVSPELGHGLTLLLHYGAGWVRHTSAANWQDWKVGLAKAFDGGWTLTGAYTQARDKHDYWTGADFSRDATGNTYTRELGKAAFVLTLSKTF